MAVVVPKNPLEPSRSFALVVETGNKIVRREELVQMLQADQLVAHAQQQARDIVAQAQQAYELERQKGYAQGLADADAKAAAMLTDLQTHGQRYLVQLESDVVQVVLRGVQTIISGFSDAELVVDTVRTAMQTLKWGKSFSVRLHPAMLAVAADRVQALQQEFPHVAQWRLLDDDSLQGAACILESEAGVVRSSVDELLRLMAESLHTTFATEAAS